MSGRSEMDRKNITLIKSIISTYPNILNNYLNSISRKTSNTKLEYIRHICNFMNYIKDNLYLNIYDYSIYNTIKPMDIDGYMEYIRYNKDGKENNGMYRASKLAAVKSFFNFLKVNGIVMENPCIDIEIPKDSTEHKITTISDDDFKIIINNIENGVGSHEAKLKQQKWKSRDKAIVLLGITTGLRMSAILGIDMNDVNLHDKTIRVIEKGDIEKIIYIGGNTIESLKEWIADRENIINGHDENALFISQKKTRMSADTMQCIIKRVTTGIDKKITPHKMRATCATRLYEQTGDIYLVQQQLGHKNIQNTRRYAKVSDERRIQAANILDSLY